MAGLVIGIRYLTGYAVATDPANRERVEWPLHPARVFMALVAAHFESGGDGDELRALEWLQSQPNPRLYAAEGDERTPVTSYVPVNDRAGPAKAALQSVRGLTRVKQPRSFPTIWLHDDRAFLAWPDAEASEHQAALEQLCAKVTRIGHSSSLVQAWVADGVPEDTAGRFWQPDDLDADLSFRVASPGLLGRLAADYQRGQRPSIGTWQGYRQAEPERDRAVAGTMWSQRLVVRRLVPQASHHLRLDLVSALQVTQRMHEAVLSQAGEPVPEFISGHQADGAPSEAPHLAYLPLAFVGRQHATGQLMGIAIALPTGLSRSQRLQALAAVGQVESLLVGPLGEWRLSADDLGKVNLRPAVWTADSRGARHWATVTPIAFDRHPKARSRDKREQELAGMIRRCCTRVGLPEPAHVVLTPVSAHLGAPPAHEFPRLRRKDGGERRHAHAVLIFDEPVRGPIALGAGRYRGYGFCRPLRSGEAV